MSRKSLPAQDAAFLSQHTHHSAVTAVEEMFGPATSVVHIVHRENVMTVTAVCQVAPCRFVEVLEVGKVDMADFLDG
jgi:hypothetical protein